MMLEKNNAEVAAVITEWITSAHRSSIPSASSN